MAVVNLYFIIPTLQLLESRVRRTHEHNGSCCSPLWFHLNEPLFLCFVPLPHPNSDQRPSFCIANRVAIREDMGKENPQRKNTSSPWQFPQFSLSPPMRGPSDPVIYRTDLLNSPTLSSTTRSPPAVMKHPVWCFFCLHANPLRNSTNG